MMQNRVTDILGIRYPIVEGGMSIAGNGLLAAAVSNGGGLGVVSSNPGWSPVASRIENVQYHIREARNNTKLPIGANVPLFHVGEYAERHIEMLIEESVEVVVTSGGSPKKLTPRLKAAGITVMHVVGNAKQAKAAEDAGVDIVVCEGYEAGRNRKSGRADHLRHDADCCRRSAPSRHSGRWHCGWPGPTWLLSRLARKAFRWAALSWRPRNVMSILGSNRHWLTLQDVATLMTTRSLGKLSRVLKTDLTMKMVELERRGAIDELKALAVRTEPSRADCRCAEHRLPLSAVRCWRPAKARRARQSLWFAVKSAAELIADMVAEADAGCRHCNRSSCVTLSGNAWNIPTPKTNKLSPEGKLRRLRTS